MRMGFDVHGVIQKYPELFKPMMEALCSMGHVVSIISGPPEDVVEAELRQMGFHCNKHYDIIFSVVDFLMLRGVPMHQDERGRWWTDDTNWWSSKSRICKVFGIDLLVDDSPQYREYFSDKSKFILITEQDLNKLFCTIIQALGDK